MNAISPISKLLFSIDKFVFVNNFKLRFLTIISLLKKEGIPIFFSKLIEFILKDEFVRFDLSLKLKSKVFKLPRILNLVLVSPNN